MWPLKLSLKLLAAVAVFVLGILIWLGRLMSDFSSWLVGLLLWVLVGCGIYCVAQARWQDVGILAVMGVAVFLSMFLLEWLVFTADQWRASLGDFLHS